MCVASGNLRNGCRERKLATCVGTLTPRVPKLRSGSFFPEDVLTCDQRAAAPWSLDGLRVPCLLLDATYVKCRRAGRVVSTAVVIAIGCDEHGWRRIPHCLQKGLPGELRLLLRAVNYDLYWLAVLGRVSARHQISQ